MTTGSAGSVGAIIQARMSSTRLPGKVLITVANKPLIQYLIDRLSLCRMLGDITVATSLAQSDDLLESYCRVTGLQCFRGALDDVAGRFNAVLENYKHDAFVRINADSPLIDPDLIDKGISIFSEGDYESS